MVAAAPPRDWPRPPWSWLLAAALGLVTVVMLLGLLAQLVLPGVAERRIRHDLGARWAQVDAVPAVTLLWGQLGHVRAHVTRLQAPEDLADLRLGDELDHARDVDIAIDELDAGGAALRDVRLRKRGDAVDVELSVSDADVDRPLGGLRAAGPVRPAGHGVELGLGYGPLELPASLRLEPVDGRVRASIDPVGPAPQVLWDDPTLGVDDLAVAQVTGGWRVSLVGRVRS